MDKTIDTPNQPNVLMVDDTPANLELLSGMLKGKGYKVRATVSGKLALEGARYDPPDLILLDINMPEMNGYEVCAKLKADEKLKDIPVIFLSALSETMDKVKAFGAGGVDYITKPFQFEEVEARVETHLKLRRQKLQLQENINKLRQFEQLRDSLVHMIVHDLRSPLTSVRGFLQLVSEDAESKLSAKSVGYIAEDLKSVNHMIGIISDILDTSRIEEGKMKLKPAEFDLAGAVEEIISGLRSLAESRKIQFTHANTPAPVVADREVVCRVVQNLLDNALKFTQDDGNILLDLAPAGDRLRLSVKDDGPGVAPEYRQKIFEKFSQVEIREGRQRYSSGLGLTFCKLAVEAHGGSIGVDSEDGKGSTFWFELPVHGPKPHTVKA